VFRRLANELRDRVSVCAIWFVPFWFFCGRAIVKFKAMTTARSKARGKDGEGVARSVCKLVKLILSVKTTQTGAERGCVALQPPLRSLTR
jgi:hypothetical protein